MIRRPPRSTLFPYTTALPISDGGRDASAGGRAPRPVAEAWLRPRLRRRGRDRKSTRLNSSHGYISYAVFCLKKKNRDDLTRDLCEEGAISSVARLTSGVAAAR